GRRRSAGTSDKWQFRQPEISGSKRGISLRPTTALPGASTTPAPFRRGQRGHGARSLLHVGCGGVRRRWHHCWNVRANRYRRAGRGGRGRPPRRAWIARKQRWLLATALDPLMPARADAVVVIAAHLGAVAIEVDANRSTPAAARAGTAHAQGRDHALAKDERCFCPAKAGATHVSDGSFATWSCQRQVRPCPLCTESGSKLRAFVTA